MKIDRHISNLLYDHDCVIVPSFGGFLVSYQPAQLQSIQHTFYPPSKKIAFNVFLKNNDGLLANFIAHKESLTYAEALKGIEHFRMDARPAAYDVVAIFMDRDDDRQGDHKGEQGESGAAELRQYLRQVQVRLTSGY